MSQRFYNGPVHDIRTTSKDKENGISNILAGFAMLHGDDILIRLIVCNMIDYWDFQIQYCTKSEWINYGMKA